MIIEGKRAFVTGGTSGIGLGISKRFLEEGAEVYTCARTQSSLDEIQEQLPDIFTIQADVSMVESIEKAYQQIDKPLDIVVVNAGISNYKTFEQVTEEEYDTLMNTNLKGAFFTIQKALNYLNPHASIILISSIAAHLNSSMQTLYGPSKLALLSLARTIGSSLADQQIRVNVISPGNINTSIWEKMNVQDDMKKAVIDRTPFKSFGEVSDIADMALYLASDKSRFITGSEFIIDGGYTQLAKPVQ